MRSFIAASSSAWGRSRVGLPGPWLVIAWAPSRGRVGSTSMGGSARPPVTPNSGKWWEPWHWGFTLNAGTASVGFGGAARADGEATRTLQAFVPARFAAPVARAAQRWSVAGTLLAAQ